MAKIKNNILSVTAFAPATCANVAVGFDILGFPIEGLGDTVTLTVRGDQDIVITEIEAEEEFPYEVDKNTATVVIKQLSQDLNINCGFSVKIKKGIPVSSGLGGSAASAVAALLAVNKFLATPLMQPGLLHYALIGEKMASGAAHADNIVPCLFGGLTLIHQQDPLEVKQLPIPEILCVLVHPHLHVPTKQAREILPKSFPLKDFVQQTAHLASFIAALYERDLVLLKKSLKDVLIEPYRAQLITHFQQVKTAALQAGALGVSISGSGPTLFAFALSEVKAQSIAEAMQKAFATANVKSDIIITPISATPARVIDINEKKTHELH
jgi:homoserine kinase